MAGPVDALSILLGGPQGPTPPLAYGSDAPAAAPTEGGAGGIQHLVDLYSKAIEMQLAQQQAQQEQAKAMQPHGILQGALQAMARNPYRESPLGDFLLSLLMGATGTPNPLTQPGVFGRGGKATSALGGLPSPTGLAAIERLAGGPQEKQATPRLMMTDQGIVLAKPGGAETIPGGEGYRPAYKPTQEKTKAPKVLTNQGVPYGVDDGTGNTYTADDPNMPGDLRKLLAAADSAHAKKLTQLTSTTRTMVETAPSLISLARRTLKEIDQNAMKLGPAIGRWNEFYAGRVGAADPSWTQLRTNIGLVTTLLMRMHVGARGGEYIMKKFDDKLSVAGQSPENLKAALREIILYANDKQREGGMNPPAQKSAPEDMPSISPGADHPLLNKYRSGQ